MKTILLFGGYGFIGSNLLQYIDNCLLQQYEIIVFDKQATHPYNFNFKCVKKVYTGDFGKRLSGDQVTQILWQMQCILNLLKKSRLFIFQAVQLHPGIEAL